jgi:hypothetical protein
METFVQVDQEEPVRDSLGHQALWFFLHTILALAAWGLFMLVGYMIQPKGVSQALILLLSIVIPLGAGALVNRFHQDEMATLVWLVGLTWILIIALWILDMPTGPNACFQCDATEKISRTFFSLPSPSGLIDDDGPFIGTWPAAALFGYAIGARLVLRRQNGRTGSA